MNECMVNKGIKALLLFLLKDSPRSRGEMDVILSVSSLSIRPS